MARNFKEARKNTGISSTVAAQKLNVSQPTISAWEREQKTPSINSLECMADLYSVTTDYLLGRNATEALDVSKRIDPQCLILFNGKPVWSKQYGWLLVNSIEKKLVSFKGEIIDFNNSGELYIQPSDPIFSILKNQEPIPKNNIKTFNEIWLEPLFQNQEICHELRGRYKVMDFWVENSSGNRFMIDRYGASWLAFEMK